MHHLQVLKDRILEINGTIKIPLQGEGVMTVKPVIFNNIVLGVNVNNLDNTPFLSIDVFIATISLLSISGQKQAIKGNAMKGKLGTTELPVNSVEGHVAKIVYGKIINDSVFRRITPISRILEWAGVCVNGKGVLKLV